MINRKEICAGIVCFNPDIELFRKNIESIANQVEYIVVFDNHSFNVDEIQNLIETIETVKNKNILIRSNENKGIAYGLNEIFQWAKRNSFSWVVTLDQDSISPPNMVAILSNHVDDKTAIIGPNIAYKSDSNYVIDKNIKYAQVAWVITSASLTRVEAWKNIGGFDEWLFIDGVDFDFCVRLRKAGYLIRKSFEVDLLHELGNLQCRKLMGYVIKITNHPPIRLYYMVRNQIYLKYKLGVGHPLKTIIKYTIKVFLFEKNKVQKMRNIAIGIFDGLSKVFAEKIEVGKTKRYELMRNENER